MSDAIVLGMIFLFGFVIFLVSYVIQKNIFIYISRKIIRFAPVSILSVIFICVYISYILTMREIKSKPVYTSMAADTANINFMIYGAIIITAITGSICGIIAGVLKLKKLNKGA